MGKCDNYKKNPTQKTPKPHNRIKQFLKKKTPMNALQMHARVYSKGQVKTKVYWLSISAHSARFG